MAITGILTLQLQIDHFKNRFQDHLRAAQQRLERTTTSIDVDATLAPSTP